MASTGYTLQGWLVDENNEVIQDVVQPLQVMSAGNQTSAPEATTQGYISGVLDKNDPLAADTGRIITLGFFDSLGYNYTAKFNIKATGNDGEYTVSLTDIVSSSNGGNSIFEIDADGKVTYNGNDVNLQDIFPDATLTFDQSEGTFKSVKIDGGDEGAAVTLNLSQLKTAADTNANPSNFEDINIDFSKCLNYNNNKTSTIGGQNGDLQGDGKGKALGVLNGITVSSDGKIYGSYDNGNTVLLCQIAVAQFANASGLEKVGNNCYQTTLNSGEFDGVGIEISADGSAISAGELEMSNVDLSSQFTDMIVTQRGFQANSRVITTSDTLLEELINLKR